ncbi:hypothetical protein DIPPA_59009, partial [Diplonema papillatum]
MIGDARPGSEVGRATLLTLPVGPKPGQRGNAVVGLPEATSALNRQVRKGAQKLQHLRETVWETQVHDAAEREMLAAQQQREWNKQREASQLACRRQNRQFRNYIQDISRSCWKQHEDRRMSENRKKRQFQVSWLASLATRPEHHQQSVAYKKDTESQHHRRLTKSRKQRVDQHVMMSRAEATNRAIFIKECSLRNNEFLKAREAVEQEMQRERLKQSKELRQNVQLQLESRQAKADSLADVCHEQVCCRPVLRVCVCVCYGPVLTWC